MSLKWQLSYEECAISMLSHQPQMVVPWLGARAPGFRRGKGEGRRQGDGSKEKEVEEERTREGG